MLKTGGSGGADWHDGRIMVTVTPLGIATGTAAIPASPTISPTRQPHDPPSGGSPSDQSQGTQPDPAQTPHDSAHDGDGS